MKTDKSIKLGQIVKAYLYGYTIEISANNIHSSQSIMVLPHHQYLVLKTGEIKAMNTSSVSRKDNLTSLKRTMRQLRRLITANFPGGKDELWVTLTYSQNISAVHQDDTKIVYSDFKIFIKRLRNKVNYLEYIAILEPQASGRWHIHVLFKTKDGSKLYIPNTKMERLWGHGFTNTKRLSSHDNVSSYVMAYVTNLKIDNEWEKKKSIKGARLYLYPKGVRIYRRSKGIINPKKITTTKRELGKLYKLDKRTRRASYRQEFIPKSSNKKIITQTEFFDKKKVKK